MATVPNGSCVLCGQPARLTDWPPLPSWLVVEGCACGGLFVWKPLWELRLLTLADEERQELAARIRDVRTHGAQAWLTTTNGRVGGPVVISAERPAGL